jgi:hypothetical protein
MNQPVLKIEFSPESRLKIVEHILKQEAIPDGFESAGSGIRTHAAPRGHKLFGA